MEGGAGDDDEFVLIMRNGAVGFGGRARAAVEMYVGGVLAVSTGLPRALSGRLTPVGACDVRGAHELKLGRVRVDEEGGFDYSSEPSAEPTSESSRVYGAARGEAGVPGGGGGEEEDAAMLDASDIPSLAPSTVPSQYAAAPTSAPVVVRANNVLGRALRRLGAGRRRRRT